jgi:hypothetical protein
VDDLVSAIAGREGPAGYRVARGTLDPEATRVGRDVAAFDPRWISDAPSDRAREPLGIRPAVAAGAVLCLAALWFLPRGRGRRAA